MAEMSLNYFRNTTLKRALLVAGLAVAIETCVNAPYGDALWQGLADGPGKSYIVNVLKDSRTGLRPLDELKLAQVILVESAANKVDPIFVLALIKTESGFFNWSRSLRGALGLMQILPSTGKDLAAKLNLKWNGDSTLLDPYLNVKMGIHYLSDLKDRYNDTDLTLTAYNEGPGNTDSRIKLGEDVSREEFVSRVLDNYRDLLGRADYY